MIYSHASDEATLMDGSTMFSTGRSAPPGEFDMRRRPSARLLVLDGAGRVLLFRFVHKKGALAGQDYWATPGGGVEEGETFEQAALRELEEETGIQVPSVGAQVGQGEFVLQLPDGEYVVADERFFVVKASSASLSRAGPFSSDYTVPSASS